MSGGSYNYLCYKDSDTLMAYTDDIHAMAERIKELSPESTHAYKETIGLLARIQEIKQQIDSLEHEKLAHVWCQVELADSFDISEADAIKAITEYQNT